MNLHLLICLSKDASVRSVCSVLFYEWNGDTNDVGGRSR